MRSLSDSVLDSAKRADRLISLGREYLGRVRFEFGADPADAPLVADCSSFTQFLFAEIGIELPRRSVWQRDRGTPVPREDIRAGDLVFRS